MREVVLENKKVQPQKLIHKWCHYCVQGRLDDEVKECGGSLIYATGQPCPFYPYRMGKGRTRMRAFRQFCLDCMGGSHTFVRECEQADCALYPYRLGKNPTRKGLKREKRKSGVQVPSASRSRGTLRRVFLS